MSEESEISEESKTSGLTTDADIDKRMKYKEMYPTKKPKIKVTVVKQRQREVKIEQHR